MEQECKETKCLTDAQEHKNIRLLLETSELHSRSPAGPHSLLLEPTIPHPHSRKRKRLNHIKSQEGKKSLKLLAITLPKQPLKGIDAASRWQDTQSGADFLQPERRRV